MYIVFMMICWKNGKNTLNTVTHDKSRKKFDRENQDFLEATDGLYNLWVNSLNDQPTDRFEK